MRVYPEQFNKDHIEKAKIFILTGKIQVFKEFFIEKIRDSYKVLNYSFNRYTKDEFDRIAYRPAIAEKWYIYVYLDMVSANNRRKLYNYFTKPSEYVIIVVDIEDNKLRKEIAALNAVYRSEEVVWMDLTRPSQSFMRRFIIDNLRPKKYTGQAIVEIMKRLKNNYEEYGYYLNLLKNTKEEIITDELVKQIIDKPPYTINHLLKCLINLDRKNVPIQALYDLIEENPVYVLTAIKNTFKYLLEAKHLLLKGELIDRGNIERDERFIKDKDKYSILNLKPSTINKYLEAARRLSLKELISINLKLDNFKYIDTQGLYKLVLELLSRRQEGLDIMEVDING